MSHLKERMYLQGTSLPSSPCITLLPHKNEGLPPLGPSCRKEATTTCQHPGCLQGHATPGSTVHTGDSFLKISGATRWLGQMSSMACHQAGEESWLDSLDVLDGARTTLGPTATGQRTHSFLSSGKVTP